MTIVRLLLLISVFSSFSWAQAEELNSPVLVEQSFSNPEKTPTTLAETRQQTLSFVFISADIIPGQEMTVQLTPEVSQLLHITRDDAGKFNVKFDEGFPEDLKNVSLTEDQDDYFELQVNGWNTASYPYSLVKAQALSETGKSVAVQFSNPNYALINIENTNIELPQWLSKLNEAYSLTEWYGFLFKEISLKETQKVQIAVSCKRFVNGIPMTQPILLMPARPYSSDIATALDSEITQWVQNEAIKKDDVSFSMDLTIYEQADDLEFPVYTIKGLDLQGTNVR